MAQKKPAVAPSVDKSITLKASEIDSLRKAIEVASSGVVSDYQKQMLRSILLKL